MPSSFQECEYIQSSGTQRIDTVVTSTDNVIIDIKFQYITATNVLLCGADTWPRNAVQINPDEAGYYKQAGSSYYDLIRYTAGTDLVEMHLQNHPITDSYANISTTVAYNNNVSFTSSQPISVFAYNRNGVYGEYSSAKLYYLQMYNGSTLVRNFVPCYCTTTVTGYKGSTAVSCASGTIGLFDLANSRFYVNSGSGTFTKGGDV